MIIALNDRAVLSGNEAGKGCVRFGIGIVMIELGEPFWTRELSRGAYTVGDSPTGDCLGFIVRPHELLVVCFDCGQSLDRQVDLSVLGSHKGSHLFHCHALLSGGLNGDLGQGPETDLGDETKVMGDPCEDLLEVGVGGEGGGEGGGGGRHGNCKVRGGEGFRNEVEMGLLGGGGQDDCAMVAKGEVNIPSAGTASETQSLVSVHAHPSFVPRSYARGHNLSI